VAKNFGNILPTQYKYLTSETKCNYAIEIPFNAIEKEIITESNLG